MQATSYTNQAENRVEISFPRAPGRFTKNALYKYQFSYEPSTRRWVRDGLNDNGVGRILYTFECENMNGDCADRQAEKSAA